MKKQAEALLLNTVSRVGLKLSVNIKGSYDTADNSYVYREAEKQGRGGRWETFLVTFPWNMISLD